ncbi:MAG: hypothetical protein JJU13_20215 [Balneolaceae bacterium]|nr:hypothetical protein [Balneolaceae bacterium]
MIHHPDTVEEMMLYLTPECRTGCPPYNGQPVRYPHLRTITLSPTDHNQKSPPPTHFTSHAKFRGAGQAARRTTGSLPVTHIFAHKHFPY